METILGVKERVEPELFAIPGVVGVAIEKGKITVYVKKITAVTLATIPLSIEGYGVTVIETGEIFATQARRDRWRPAPGGVSVGHNLVTAGTLAATVIDNISETRVILSNNHVLANMDSIQNSRANIGDEIWQPGRLDGGSSADTIAHLERWVPFDEEGTNTVDCAIAMPINDADLDDDVLEIGIVNETADAIVDETVRKSGRTTALTSGEISSVNTSINVNYGQFTARFTDCISIPGPFNDHGDSGSLLVNSNNRAIGLVFANSELEDGTVIRGFANKISNVINDLNIGFGEAPEEPEPGVQVTINYTTTAKNIKNPHDIVVGASIFTSDLTWVADLPWWVIVEPADNTEYTIPISHSLGLVEGNYILRARAWKDYDLVGATQIDQTTTPDGKTVIVYEGGNLYNMLDQMDGAFMISPPEIVSADINNMAFSFG